MSIKIRNMMIDYGNAIAVENLTLSVETGELVSLLGPSGCGKTTTLNAIAGLLQVSSGQILFDGIDVTKTSPQKRNIGLVFQNYALYPHLTVFKNIAFPLYQNKEFKNNIKQNNQLINLKIKDLNQTGSSINKKEYKKEILKVFKNIWEKNKNEFVIQENLILDAFKKKANETALYIYGDGELNAFRSRIYVMWMDQIKSFIEQQRLIFIMSFLKTIKNKNLKELKVNDDIKFVFENFQKQIIIKNKSQLKKEYNQLHESYLSHKKTLLEEVKNITSIKARKGEQITWKLDLKERDKTLKEYENFYKNKTNAFNVWVKQIILAGINEKDLQSIKDLSDKKINIDIKNETYKDEILKLKKNLKKFKIEVKNAVLEVANKVEITTQLKKRPSELSGGQQQRVAIARAIVKKPNVLLLDEPLSNLDAKLRVSTREWIKNFQRSTGITTVFVTHDQEEAMSISDKVFVMSKGILQQAGKPMEIYKAPNNKFVANFIGTPSMNFFDKADISKNGIVSLNKIKAGQIKDNNVKSIILGIRPEHLEIHQASNSSKYLFEKPIEMILKSVENLGRTNYFLLDYDGMKVELINEAGVSDIKIKPGDKVKINALKNSGYIFNSKTTNKELVSVI